MESDQDQIWENLIEDFRPRLRRHIVVEQVLDYAHFIAADQKELIRQKASTAGDVAAADDLISAVVRGPHAPGWFQAFVDALSSCGCEYAADYMQVNLPEPEVEAENDARIRLIEILSPSLVDMKTVEVCLHCFSQHLITAEDAEVVRAKLAGGNRNGARELLRRIVRGRPGWFSTFLKILRDTEHPDLYQLTGGSPDCDKDDKKLPSVKAGTTGSEAAREESSAGPQSLSSPDVGMATETEDDATDLYSGENADSGQPPEPPQPDGNDSAAAAGGAESADIVLRDYQMDVARPALEGENVIVCLPTGSGKTRVAVYVTKKHLDGKRAEGQSGKVVVLVKQVALVEQHYNTEFHPFLRHTYKVARVSGDSQLRISFTEIVKKNDVIICTAQILENYLERSTEGEDEGVHLKDLTLLVIDECHHTKKGEVYNHIMMRYLKQKHKNIRTMKVQDKEPVPLPQILGLTASPGVGGATKMSKAEEHILRICANLDASKILTRSLEDSKKELNKEVAPVEDRTMDPFGDVIKKIMNTIHCHVQLSPASELDSQNYEQWIVKTERGAAKDGAQELRVCAEHLRQYNEALQLNNTIRMRDAFGFLNKYHDDEMRRKATPEEEQTFQITDTERFLFNLFQDNKEELERLAENPEYENGSLSKLKGKILREFSSRAEPRGIIFTKTRRSAIALCQWIQENPKFADIGVEASYVIGAGTQSLVKPMTSAEQDNVLNKFRAGNTNLLIATTVAEEGLDIPQCNFVIRYGLVTNEISMIQSEGRGRAADSSHTLVDVKGSGVAEKECVNEYRKDLMNKAIAKICGLSQADYASRITEFQCQSIVEDRVRKTQKKQKNVKQEKPSELKLSCRGCNKHVCTGEDIQVIEGAHRVNVSSEFSELFVRTENPSLRGRPLEYEPSSFMACKDCRQSWGTMMFHRGIECPCLLVKNFVVAIGDKKMAKCTKWSELAVQFAAFNYAEHAMRLAHSSDDEETA